MTKYIQCGYESVCLWLPIARVFTLCRCRFSFCCLASYYDLTRNCHLTGNSSTQLLIQDDAEREEMQLRKPIQAGSRSGHICVAWRTSLPTSELCTLQMLHVYIDWALYFVLIVRLFGGFTMQCHPDSQPASERGPQNPSFPTHRCSELRPAKGSVGIVTRVRPKQHCALGTSGEKSCRRRYLAASEGMSNESTGRHLHRSSRLWLTDCAKSSLLYPLLWAKHAGWHNDPEAPLLREPGTGWS